MNKPARNTDLDRDANRDPITGAPGSHPVGTGLGGIGGGAAGMAIGALFGPIGLLVGGVAGTIAGAAAGHGVAEAVDPTTETEYWKTEYAKRPYYKKEYTYERDYLPAYTYGTTSRTKYADRTWDNTLESDLSNEWNTSRGSSTLEWNDARPAIRDAWDRTDRTYRAYNNADKYYQPRFESASYRDPSYSYDDYQSAYRYGTYARQAYPTRQWDDSLERDLESGWERAKGKSRLSWEKAKHAAKDAWHSIERAIPGDADNDGR